MEHLTQPLITIITLTYKRFDRIFETINSVIWQDYKNIEYIIADDGSDNFPREEIESFIKVKACFLAVKILHATKNRGTVRNLNNAIKESNGEYIFHLSCGDVFFSKDVVTKLVERFLSTNGKVIVASRLMYTNDYEPICFLPHYCERRIIQRHLESKQQYEMFVAGHFYDMASGSAMYYSRKIIEELGFFDEQYVLWEDGPFFAKYLYKYPLTFAYDIISIWYEIGGVSTGKEINPLLIKDSEFFNATERLEHIDKLRKCEQKRLQYIVNGYKKSGYDRLKLRIKNPIQFLFFQKIRIQRKIFKILDKFFIKLIKNNI